MHSENNQLNDRAQNRGRGSSIVLSTVVVYLAAYGPLATWKWILSTPIVQTIVIWLYMPLWGLAIKLNCVEALKRYLDWWYAVMN